MTFLQLFVLAIVQGVTEFLPVSSNAHLLLVPALTGEDGHLLAIDLAVNVGTLLAVIAYLWRDSWSMVHGLYRFVRTRRGNPGLVLIGLLILGSIPIFAAGYGLREMTGSATFKGPEIVAWTTFGFGILLYVIDKMCLTVRRMEHLGAGSAIVIGFFQILALLPGTSRAGITMTAARLLGYERPDAARFSMLLAIPTIIASSVMLGVDLDRLGNTQIGFAAILAVVTAFIVAFVAIAAMMSWLKEGNFTPFAVYRVLLGLFLLIWLYTSWFSGFMPPSPH
ncbi:MAG: undecaprenyl-diphosphate phosphatase [Candidatus Eiseniibacteriota bacterium]